MARIGALNFPNAYIGALRPEQMRDANRMGLLMAGLGLLEAGGPSDRPVSMGQAFAGGARQGIGARDQFGRDSLTADEVLRGQKEREAFATTRGKIGALGPNAQRSQIIGALMESENPGLFGTGVTGALENNEPDLTELYDPETDQYYLGPKAPGAQTKPGEGAKRDVDAANETFDREKDLRGEHAQRSGDFIKLRDAYNKIEEASKDESGAADMALVFGYMKMLDPSSTVREGEYASAQNTAGIPERIRNLYNQAIDGSFLSPPQRQSFVKEASKIMAQQSASQVQTDLAYSDIAARSKASPRNVVVDYGSGVSERAQANIVRPVNAPRQGEVRGGWRFNGGDPMDEANYTKVP